VKAPIARTISFTFALCVSLALSAVAICAQTQTRVRVAVLDFGESQTGIRAAETVREALTIDKLAVDYGLSVIDRNLAIAAALGNGYQGSLNLTTREARDMGAAIGCDFFIIGNAETLKRSPSNGADYFEAYAVIFIVSARTGQLIWWQRPAERRDNPAEAEKALLKTAISATASQLRVSILRAFEDEAAARAAAVESPPATVEVMSDDEDKKTDAREPRPYRRLKPPYPDAANQAEVEAVVDVLVDIDARGEVGKIELARWAGYGLDQSVIDTVKQMHFFPAMREGVAIPMRVLLRYNFRHTTPDKPPVKTLIIPRPKG
jgi:TonB family protein